MSPIATEAGPGRPRVLMVALMDFPFSAMLAISLRRSGLAVDALCPTPHALWHTEAVDRYARYRRWRPIGSLRRAIRDFAPTLLVPSDDPALLLIAALYRDCQRRDDAVARNIAELIERSLGPAGSFDVTVSRSSFMRTVHRCAIRAPETLELNSAAELRQFCARAQFPIVLKRDGSFGGRGVAIVRSLEEATAAYTQLTMPQPLRSCIKDLVLRFDLQPIFRRLFSLPEAITSQSYVKGSPAHRAVLCWRGEVLAGISARAVETNPAPSGPATVVEAISDPEMEAAVRAIARNLGLSGFCGFDFVIEETTDLPFLVELNARATPSSLIDGTAQTDAMFRAITGRAAPADQAARNNARVDQNTIAFFPQEWVRCPESQHLKTAYSHVPWDEPTLLTYIVSAVIEDRRGGRGLLGRFRQRWRGIGRRAR
jgi:hypothetical protein